MRALEESPDAFGATPADEGSLPDRAWVERTEQTADNGNAAAFIAEAPAGWIGFVMIRLDDGEPTRAGMFGLWVDPASRGRGVGRSLTEAAISWACARAARTLTLWVVASNSAAIGLYRGAGFVATGKSMPMPRQPELIEIQMEKDGLGRG